MKPNFYNDEIINSKTYFLLNLLFSDYSILVFLMTILLKNFDIKIVSIEKNFLLFF